MTIQECYQQLGGSFAHMEQRLSNVSLIKQFAAKFLDDNTFSELCSAMQSGEREKAFRAAHTLKGVCANLSFDRLRASAAQLTESLRQKTDTISEDAFSLLENVKKEVSAIRAFLASEGAP